MKKAARPIASNDTAGAFRPSILRPAVRHFPIWGCRMALLVHLSCCKTPKFHLQEISRCRKSAHTSHIFFSPPATIYVLTRTITTDGGLHTLTMDIY